MSRRIDCRRRLSAGAPRSVFHSQISVSVPARHTPHNKTASLAVLLLMLALQAHLQQQAAYCLRISSIEIPAAVSNGSQVTLACNYELAAGEQLYSVKWYKDYVEFYRFQPAEQGAAEQESGQAQQPQQKHGFDWDGINLDLSKCNGTHVHLKQVGLTTEATFKCEVSADSPSFATVSAERQLKIYVLPKQKLAIIDNSLAAASWPQPQQPAPQPQASSGEPSGELINLSCVCGPSLPRAHLSWLVNEVPVSAAALERQSGAHRQLINVTDSVNLSSGARLSEARSTLQVRLQPGLGYALAALASAEGAPASLEWRHLRVSCLAWLSLEYRAETSVIVSASTPGGSAARRQQWAAAPPLDAPPVRASRPQTPGARRAPPAHRWPQLPAGVLAAGHADGRRTPPQPNASGVLVVWTSRQLKTQVEHIERLLRVARPNELDTPLIEARALGSRALSEPEPAADLSASETVARTGPAPDSVQFDDDPVAESNELVRFVCLARSASAPGGRGQAEQLRLVRLGWLINDKPVASGQLVNSFDGERFSYRPANGSSRQRPQWLGAELEQAGQARLALELNAELLRLKELALKCRALLEYPLIEYEAHWHSTGADNAPAYIQVPDERPTSRAYFHQHAGAARQAAAPSQAPRQRSNVIKGWAPQSQGASSSAAAVRLGPHWLVWSLVALWQPALWAAALVAADHRLVD